MQTNYCFIRTKLLLVLLKKKDGKKLITCAKILKQYLLELVNTVN